MDYKTGQPVAWNTMFQETMAGTIQAISAPYAGKRRLTVRRNFGGICTICSSEVRPATLADLEKSLQTFTNIGRPI